MDLNRSTDALLIIDLQNDFCPAVNGLGGALAISGADQIVPRVNRVARAFDHVILTQDWHPCGHISFASAHPGAEPYQTVRTEYGEQALWPDHCVQETYGAELYPALDVPHAEFTVRKGSRREMDSYSAFLENDHQTATGLAGYLHDRGIQRLFLCGLAYDFCVRHSAIDGVAFDFEVYVIEDACRAVGLPGSVRAADQAFEEAGVQRISSADIAP